MNKQLLITTYNTAIKFLAAYLLLLATLSGYAQNTATLTGEISGFGNVTNTAVSVNRYNGYSYILHETVTVNADSKFSLTKLLPEGFYQLSIPTQGVVSAFYSSGNIPLQAQVTYTQYEKDKVTFRDNENRALNELLAANKLLEIKLNSINEQFDPRQFDSFYLQKLIPYHKEVQQAYREFNSNINLLKSRYSGTVVMGLFSSFYQLPLFDEDKVAAKYYDNQDAYMRDHFFDLWKLDDERISQLPEIKLKLEKYFRFFGKKNHSFLTKKCDDILSRAKNQKVKAYLASLLIDFFTQVKENDIVAHIVDNNLKGCFEDIDLSLINFTQNNLRGTKISALELPDQNGRPVKLSTIYSNAKFTVLYFYSTDCNHCRDFHPIAKKLKEQYGKQLAVYAACMEDDEAKWKNTISEFGLNFTNVNARGEQRKQVKQLFSIKYTPTVFVLNSAGEIVDKDLYIDDISQAIDSLLK